MSGGDWDWLAILGWGISHGVFDPQTGLGAVLCAWLSRKPWLPIAAALLIAIGDTYLLPGQFARFGEWGPWVIAGRFIGAFLQGMIVSGIAVALRRRRQRIARTKESESST
jgi:hypothetical protein